MKKITKALSLVMALAMAFALAVPSFAATEVTANNGLGTTAVELKVAATRMSVTVPTTLVVDVDEYGAATCATAAKITNNSFGAVKVSGLAVEATDDYTIVDFGTNMKLELVDAKKIGLKINDETTTGADAISFSQSNWGQIDGVNDTNSDELAITYDAVVSAVSEALAQKQVANVIFTIAWSK